MNIELPEGLHSFELKRDRWARRGEWQAKFMAETGAKDWAFGSAHAGTPDEAAALALAAVEKDRAQIIAKHDHAEAEFGPIFGQAA